MIVSIAAGDIEHQSILKLEMKPCERHWGCLLLVSVHQGYLKELRGAATTSKERPPEPSWFPANVSRAEGLNLRKKAQEELVWEMLNHRPPITVHMSESPLLVRSVGLVRLPRAVMDVPVREVVLLTPALEFGASRQLRPPKSVCAVTENIPRA